MKNVRRFSALFCALALMLLSCATVYALSVELIDDANVFDSEQTEKLEEKMQELSDETGWQVVIYTGYDYVDSEDMDEYFEEFYDTHDFDYDCVLFAIDMGNDNRIIHTYGDARDYLDDSFDRIKSQMKPYLNDGDMYGATLKFLELASICHSEGLDTDYYDDDYYSYDDGDYRYDDSYLIEEIEKQSNPLLYSLKKNWIIYTLVSLAAGVTVFVVVVIKYKTNGKHNTYDLKSNGRVNLDHSQDIFLHKKVTVVHHHHDDNNNHNSSSSHSGGSTFSSGGSSHGSSGSF